LSRTGKTDTHPNRFYEKGAAFVRMNVHHAGEINEWHKEIISVKKNND